MKINYTPKNLSNFERIDLYLKSIGYSSSGDDFLHNTVKEGKYSVYTHKEEYNRGNPPRTWNRVVISPIRLYICNDPEESYELSLPIELLLSFLKEYIKP